jgi:hypothetical protein
MTIDKRKLLGLGLGLGAGLVTARAFAQAGGAPPAAGGRGRREVPHRKATTTVLFNAPKDKYINGIAAAPEGFWLVEQKENGGPNSTWRYKDGTPLAAYSDLHETAWLVDDKGAIKKTVVCESRNTSGLAYGGGYLWLGSNSGGHNGVAQVDMNGKTVSHRQVPFGPADDGGGIHGLDYVNGKLWIASLRLRCLVKIDPITWIPEWMLPMPAQFSRYHGCAYDTSNDTMLIVMGSESSGYANAQTGIARLDGKTGALVEIIDFAPNTADPHGLTFKDGKLISCDAGLHPGWPINDSPYSGAIFQVNIA